MAIDLNHILTEIRKDSCDYDALLCAIKEVKKVAQTSFDEAYANWLWGVETIVEIHQQFIQTFKLLKSDRYYDAWCMAEKLEISIIFLARNLQECYDSVKDIYSIVHQLQSLYPYKLFASYVLLIKNEKCSICGTERSIRNLCGHRIGMVYNGELCCNIITDAEFKGVDIVENPVNKYSVVFPSDAEGCHDQYDYTLVKELLKYWNKPFQSWKYMVRNDFKQKTDFPGLNNKSLCPCGSGKLYGKCCAMNSNGIKHRIYTFILAPID